MEVNTKGEEDENRRKRIEIKREKESVKEELVLLV